MPLTAIYNRLRETDNMNLLGLLPSADSMRWVDEPMGMPPKALVIGTSRGHDIIAFLIRKGDKPLELRFATGAQAHTTLFADDLITLKLHDPFNYLKGPTKSEKSRLSYFIKYYFLKASWVDGGIGGDQVDMAKKIQSGLRLILEKKMEERKHFDKGKRKHDNQKVSGETEVLVENHASREGMKTRSAGEADMSPPASFRKPSKDNSNSNDSVSDYDKLKDLLETHNELYLLDNIPAAEEMTFEEQDLVPKALPKKLLVGRLHDAGNIYAYMRFNNNFHEIRFISDGSVPRHLTAEMFAKQQVFHPFNKTFDNDVAIVDQSEKARITLIVKWYFIAAGIAKNCVLKETRDYPNRFRNGLAYIAERMGSAATKPPYETSARNDELDESHIQSTLSARPSSSSPSNPPNHDHSILQQPTPTATSGSSSDQAQSRKRTAEDAELDDLERTITEDRQLTKEMNEMDDKIDSLRMQLQALEEEREKFDEARRDVRKRLKRQSLAFARVTEEE